MTCPCSFEEDVPGPELIDISPERDWNRITENERAHALANLQKLGKIWMAQEPKPKRLENSKKLARAAGGGGGLNPLRWEPPE